MKRALGVCAVVGVMMSFVAPALGTANNGFDTDYVYALESSSADGQLTVFNETSSTIVTADLLPGGADHTWSSLTFSGVGDDDAKLFLARRTWNNLLIINRMSPAGTIDVTLDLKNLVPEIGSASYPTIRFTKARPGSVFISCTEAMDGGSYRAMVYEVSLDLSTLKATYTGPICDVKADVCMTLDETDGAIYLSGHVLNGEFANLDGDVVRIDTSGGTTDQYTTLIDGMRYQNTQGTTNYHRPWEIIYRPDNAGVGAGDSPTLLINMLAQGAATASIEEFYLDTTNHAVDADGNLARRGTAVAGNSGLHGQVDELTDTVWMGATNVRWLKDDDTAGTALSTAVNYVDADSPVTYADGTPAIAAAPNPDTAYPEVEYVRQMFVTAGGSAPLTWSLLQGPGAVDADTGVVSSWTPTVSDTGATFQVAVTNDAWSTQDTETWYVAVNTDAVAIATVPTVPTLVVGETYYDKMSLSAGALPVTWSLAQAPAGLTIDSAGLVAWTPTASDGGRTHTLIIAAANETVGIASSDTETYVVTVDGVPPTITEVTPDPKTVYANAAGTKQYAEQMTLVSSTPPVSLPVTWSLLQGPSGADVDSDGLVTWTPTSGDVGHTYPFEVEASNASLTNGGTDTESWVVDVALSAGEFDPDYVYAISDTTAVVSYRESDGVAGDYISDMNDWDSLTFAGDGSTDPRLFMMRSLTDDVNITEFQADGTIVKSKDLIGDLLLDLGVTSLGAKIIRYSEAHSNSVFVAGWGRAVGGAYNAKVWQIDLALTTLQATYTGPRIPEPRDVMMDMDDDGNIYLVSKDLGTNKVSEITDAGDVVMMDTSGGTTSSFTTLIDGDAFAAAYPGVWNKPWYVAYRSYNPTDGTPTLLVSFSANIVSASDVQEFYLDTATHPMDATTSSLQWKGPAFQSLIAHAGQQDPVTGTVWWGDHPGNVVGLGNADTVYRYGGPSTMYYDADSPKGVASGAPTIAEVSPDPDDAYVGGEYVQRLALTAGATPVTWSVLTGPTGAEVDSDGLVTGWTPQGGDWGTTVDFEIKATNGPGNDTEAWQVVVGGTAPSIDTVGTVYFEYGGMYSEQLVDSAGEPAPTWSLIAGPTGAYVAENGGMVAGWTPVLADVGTTVTFTVAATNESGTDQETWTVSVDPVTPVVAEIVPNPHWTLENVEYQKVVTLTEGTPPINWTLTTGPATATVAPIGDPATSTSALISGWTPAGSDVGSTFPITVRADNYGISAQGGAYSRSMTVEVVGQNFDPGYVYVIDLGNGRAVTAVEESTGAVAVTDLLSSLNDDDSNWTTMTFAGVGPLDARLFGARQHSYEDPPGTYIQKNDARIVELAGDGTLLNAVWLDDGTNGALYELYDNPLISTYDGVSEVMVRWSSYYPDSLFLGAVQYRCASEGTEDQATLWELDLDLTTVKKVFYGPSDLVQPDMCPFAIDDRNGDIYMTNKSLNRPTDDNKGDMIKIDYASGSDSWATVVTGANFSDSVWWRPHGLMIHSQNPDVVANNEPTLLVACWYTAANYPAAMPEFYVDSWDGSKASLAQRTGSPWTINAWMWKGQEDEITNILWAGERTANGNLRLKKDDPNDSPSVGNEYFSYSTTMVMEDADSPNLIFPVRCEKDPMFDADEDGDVDMEDFAVFQLCITEGYSMGGVSTPALSATCECNDWDGDGEVDETDLTMFVGCASGPGVPALTTCDD